MHQSRRNLCFVLATLMLCLTAGPAPTRIDPVAFQERALENKYGDTYRIAYQAYLYGYPLVTMEMTRRVMTNVETVQGTRGPMGRFVHARQFPNAKFRDVTAPNADTLYSSAWLDLGKEPYILSLPDVDGRYYLMPILSAWTDVLYSPGTRTTGTKAQKYALTGPGWKGTLPEGVVEYKSPTDLVWIIGRTYCTGTPEDYKAVHALQDKYGLVPLSSFGKQYTPPAGKVDPKIDMKTPVRDQVHKMDVDTYFGTLSELLKNNPPAKADAEMVGKLAKIGIVPGHAFDAKLYEDPVSKKAVRSARTEALAAILAEGSKTGKDVNGWRINTDTGRYYGNAYLHRAFIAAVGLGANLPQDAVYPMSKSDSEGKAYDGASKYVLHFPKGKTPPVKGFWSLTMYDESMFFVDNVLDRYSLNSRDKFKYNEDGSLDLYVQKDSPGKEREANWLPAPPGKFVLMLRLYWPRTMNPSILDGTWQPPAVKRAG